MIRLDRCWWLCRNCPSVAPRATPTPRADVDARVAAERAWWDLCETGPRVELDQLTHGEHDNMWFYWAWNVADDTAHFAQEGGRRVKPNGFHV